MRVISQNNVFTCMDACAHVRPAVCSLADGTGTSLVLSVTLPPEVRATVVVPVHVGGGPATVVVTEGADTVWAAGRATHANADIAASLARGMVCHCSVVGTVLCVCVCKPRFICLGIASANNVESLQDTIG